MRSIASGGPRRVGLFLLGAAVSILVAACSRNTAPGTEPEAEAAAPKKAPELVPAREAVEKADVLKIFPETMDRADADRVLQPGPECSFAFTGTGDPVVVARAPTDRAAFATGVAQLHGRLVELRSREAGGFQALAAGTRLAADGLELTLTPTVGDEESRRGRRQWPADLVLRLEQGPTRGWRGFYRCDA